MQEARAVLEQDLALLSSCDLSKVNLTGLDLSGADLSGANICGADLREVNLSDVNFFSALYDDETQWPEGFDYQNSGVYYIGPN